MPTFKKPNLQATRGASGRAYISVYSNRQALGFNCRAVRELQPEDGQHLHLALDDSYRPWIGFLDEPTDQGEPAVNTSGPGVTVHSTLMCRHLVRLVDGESEDTLRFHLNGETAEDPDTGATLHRLEVPDAE